MNDRIADPWGSRTPYPRAAEWPIRVDTYLEGGMGPDEVERWVPTASILHSNGDALDIAVKDGRMVGVRGRADSRVNRGRLGPKDLFGWQANASPDRLTRPQRALPRWAPAPLYGGGLLCRAVVLRVLRQRPDHRRER
jgi:anaerobic selenocysteine-containing dehydrogenase